LGVRYNARRRAPRSIKNLESRTSRCWGWGVQRFFTRRPHRQARRRPAPRCAPAQCLGTGTTSSATGATWHAPASASLRASNASFADVAFAAHAPRRCNAASGWRRLPVQRCSCSASSYWCGSATRRDTPRPAPGSIGLSPRGAGRASVTERARARRRWLQCATQPQEARKRTTKRWSACVATWAQRGGSDANPPTHRLSRPQGLDAGRRRLPAVEGSVRRAVYADGLNRCG
jgi:hypothetical protein